MSKIRRLAVARRKRRILATIPVAILVALMAGCAFLVLMCGCGSAPRPVPVEVPAPREMTLDEATELCYASCHKGGGEAVALFPPVEGFWRCVCKRAGPPEAPKEDPGI